MSHEVIEDMGAIGVGEMITTAYERDDGTCIVVTLMCVSDREEADECLDEMAEGMDAYTAKMGALH